MGYNDEILSSAEDAFYPQFFFLFLTAQISFSLLKPIIYNLVHNLNIGNDTGDYHHFSRDLSLEYI